MGHRPDTGAGQSAAQEDWENEGGGLQPWGAEALPEGMTARTITEYCVGPFRYTDRALAEAEWRRQSGTRAHEITAD